jgi:hypothetical protein
MNSEMNPMSLYLNGVVGDVVSSASGQNLPTRDVEPIYVSRKKRPAIETETLAGPESFNDKLLKCRLLYQVVAMIGSHKDDYEDALENDPDRVRLHAHGNGTVRLSPFSCWPKAAVRESEGDSIQNLSCTVDLKTFV